jgi:hypothetical protein
VTLTAARPRRLATITTALAFLRADPAASLAVWAEDEVVASVGMALRAMRLASVASRPPEATKIVLCGCDDFEMRRIHARPIATEVV